MYPLTYPSASRTRIPYRGVRLVSSSVRAAQKLHHLAVLRCSESRSFMAPISRIFILLSQFRSALIAPLAPGFLSCDLIAIDRG